MKSQDFEEACEGEILGWIWDESLNLDYDERVTLTIKEMRFIANLLREKEGRKIQTPRYFTESAEELANKE